MEKDRSTRFEALVAAVGEPVRRFLHRRTDADTAEDVLAETLLVCWRRLDEVPDEALPWAYVVARHCLANAERSQRRQTRLVGRIRAVDPPVVSTPGPDAGDDTLDRALASLAPDDAEVLRLWAWEDLGAGAVGTVLGISPNAASIRLHRAKQRLKAALGKNDGPDGHGQDTERSRG